MTITILLNVGALVVSFIGIGITILTYKNTLILNESEYNRIPQKLKYSLISLKNDLIDYQRKFNDRDIFINTGQDSLISNIQGNIGKFLEETKNPYIIRNIHQTSKILTSLGGILTEEKQFRKNSDNIYEYIELISEQIRLIDIEMNRKRNE